MAPCVLWFRRDLRLCDNLALLAAAEASGADGVVPLFVLDPALWGPSGDPRRAFLVGCLKALDEALGGTLLVRHGDPVAEVLAVARHYDAEQVYVSADFGPYGHRRDVKVGAALHSDGRRLLARGSSYAVDPGTLESTLGRPFRVFTPFSKAWRAHGWPAPPPEPAARFVSDLASHGIPQAPAMSLPHTPGEVAGRQLLKRFIETTVAEYAESRDRPGRAGTSRLSPHLKFGTIHPRTVLALLGQSPGEALFASELCWREFYADVLWTRPDTVRQPFNATLATMEIDTGPGADARFAAWAAGRTGFPIVDAGMRQLATEGWMHNRVRMITASFLVKDLHLEWRRGAKFFLDHLVDGDLASNHHGWQWVAGTGTDASPYFRVFNPVAQSQRFDPNGDYLATYLPELASLSAAHRHEPWLARASGFDLGDYPEPMVDHAAERLDALARYAAARET